MNLFRKSVPLILILVLFFANKSTACTSIIITGKATPDGRPLMWKHRDTGAENNRMVYATGTKYSYIGLTNSDDIKNEEIWAGTNNAGFCIMNTASYNLKGSNDTTKFEDREGMVMRMALEVCATIEDFERFLDTITKPIGIEANFGVIDAQGGAAYYETNNFSYTKYDVNDTEIAPNNYMIRTNYSVSGFEDKGMGYIRYENAKYIFANNENKFTPEWILSSAARSYYHSLLNIDLRELKPQFAIDQDYIPRKSSSASVVFQGVKKGENAERTTMWTALGFPSCSIVFPLWVKGGEHLPEILIKSENSNNAPLCDKVVALKHKVFGIKRGNGEKYMNFALLYNKNKDGIIQKIQPYEEQIFEETYKKIDEWNKTSWNEKNIREYYGYLNTKITKIYKDLFDL